MPGWSPEIANEFIRLAAADGRAFDQLQLQGLVYIAHGWCLALHGEPLTGDRPEAWEFGPMYRRLADALAAYGRKPVTREITKREAFGDGAEQDGDGFATSELDAFESRVVADIYHSYAHFEAYQLASLTAGDDSPWAHVFADGAGIRRDISHELVKAQFVELLRQSEESQQRS